MRSVTVLGSTGTIGTKALDIIREHPGRFRVAALAAGTNVDMVVSQAVEFAPSFIAVGDSVDLTALHGRLARAGWNGELASGMEGLSFAAGSVEADIVLSAVSGTAGIMPTYAAVSAGRTVALANKESIVACGELMLAEARRSGATIIPVDSEHSALYQLLSGVPREHVRRVVLTASGGPFLNVPLTDLARMTAKDALSHPVWNMGRKITIDSATLANKGLEVIEAHYLFGTPYDDIAVFVHPTSIIHGLVELTDGSLLAHMGVPDMRLPIANAFFHPGRMATAQPLSLDQLANLQLLPVDTVRFPFLGLAYAAGRAGRSCPVVFNTADEIAVSAFLEGRIGYLSIHDTVAEALEHHVPRDINHIDDVAAVEAETRIAVAAIIARREVR